MALFLITGILAPLNRPIISRARTTASPSGGPFQAMSCLRYILPFARCHWQCL